jgi:hypothetical protein
VRLGSSGLQLGRSLVRLRGLIVGALLSKLVAASQGRRQGFARWRLARLALLGGGARQGEQAEAEPQNRARHRFRACRGPARGVLSFFAPMAPRGLLTASSRPARWTLLLRCSTDWCAAAPPAAPRSALARTTVSKAVPEQRVRCLVAPRQPTATVAAADAAPCRKLLAAAVAAATAAAAGHRRHRRTPPQPTPLATPRPTGSTPQCRRRCGATLTPTRRSRGCRRPYARAQCVRELQLCSPRAQGAQLFEPLFVALLLQLSAPISAIK